MCLNNLRNHQKKYSQSLIKASMFMANDYAIEKKTPCVLMQNHSVVHWLHIEILCQSLESNIWLSIYNTAVLEILYN